MDPEANYDEQKQLYGSKDPHDRARLRELVAALRGWVAAGGFKPRSFVGPAWSPRKEAQAAKPSPAKEKLLTLAAKALRASSIYSGADMANALLAAAKRSDDDVYRTAYDQFDRLMSHGGHIAARNALRRVIDAYR